jgi:succinate dehydrogenase/fumarate reductase flavoprotein subunit
LLAGAIGVSAEALEATVNKYNDFVENKNDADFNKPAAQLTKKIMQGPFYAVKLYPESHISMGGPVSDATGRVLNEEGLIIPHLYAVGELSNREFYNVNYVGAASLALYPTIGRIAGLDAAKDARYNK